jgi:hypothetical protein
MPPVHRRKSKSEATRRYEQERLATGMDVMPRNAVAEPISTSAIRPAMIVVAVTAYTGIEVLGLI